MDDPYFKLVFNRNQASIVHLSQYIQLLPVAGYDVIVLFPLGVLQVIFGYGFWKGDPDFIWC